jgi:hypothetical protein
MNDVRVDEREPDDERLLQVSTFESLMIQALVNQLTDIVTGRKISYENKFKQAQTLQLLAQTALMLTDSESIYLHGEKLQDFFNRVFLEHTLGAKASERTIARKPVDNASNPQPPEPGAEFGEGEP